MKKVSDLSLIIVLTVILVSCKFANLKAASTHVNGRTVLPERLVNVSKSLQYVQDGKQCIQSNWYDVLVIDATGKQECYCLSDFLPQFTCSEDGFETHLEFGSCATYSHDSNKLSVSQCLSFRPFGFNITKPGYILLPKNTSELNGYMCGHMNRKDNVCSKCIDGFGPSVTSLGYQCTNCTNAWHGVPLYLFLELSLIHI